MVKKLRGANEPTAILERLEAAEAEAARAYAGESSPRGQHLNGNGLPVSRAEHSINQWAVVLFVCIHLLTSKRHQSALNLSFISDFCMTPLQGPVDVSPTRGEEEEGEKKKE